ncbi:V-set and immunoglobulin domain-containing protein 2 [Amia ocellicauda]|uniref:V-set and immunoglobulin domain-containing protein 2 n=1 Tax=Amia ocellicauda TaxID=2972642 RepID=UPI003464245B|nr:VSIG2 protein [Amia calva]
MAPSLNVPIVLVTTLYFGSVFARQAVTVSNPIFATMGTSQNLPCQYSTTPLQGFTLEWSFIAPGTQAINSKRVLYYDGKVYWVTSWDGRMELLQNPPDRGDASIRILDVQPSDTGLYICEVTNPKDWSGSGQGLINFTVLMPPSTPVCKMNGQPYQGNDVTLSCHSSQGLPQPIYSWTREKTPNQAPLPAANVVEDQRAGTLLLRNLSSPFSGRYVCQASNELGTVSCRVNVSVSYTSTAGVIAGAIMGTFLILLVLGGLAGFLFWQWKTKNKKVHTGNEIRVDDVAPGYHTPRQGGSETGSHLLKHSMERQETSSLASSRFNVVV